MHVDGGLGDPERVDTVPGDLETTAFKQRARRHQSEWREARGLRPGTHPVRPSDDHWRFIGSRIDIREAYETGANFVTVGAKAAADERLANPEPHQTLDRDRLYGDLLSSMPMCFNLFGPLHADIDLADRAVHTWWPETPGRVSAVRFEWSPGRRIDGQYLGNRSAFDVAFELDIGGGRRGVIGVETKYHEDCKREATPDKTRRLPRYEAVAQASGAFVAGAADEILGTPPQQIWLDHLLALSMPQTDPGTWVWVKFVLVHPAANPSYARVAERYRGLLLDESTFHSTTIESLLDAGVLPSDSERDFRTRYLW